MTCGLDRSGAAPRSRRTSRIQRRYRAPLRRARRRPTDIVGAHPGDRRPQHRALRPPRRGDDGRRSHDVRSSVRHHPRRRLEPRQPHRLVARRAARLRRPDAAVQRRLPRRREHPALALPGRGRRLRGGLAPAHRATTRFPPSWAGSATTRARRPATGPSSTRRSGSTPSSGSWATSRSSEGWRLARPAGADTGKRVLVVGSGPGGLSAAYHLRRLGHSVVLVESAPLLGGMMRYGIPAYRLPRDVLEAEIERDSRPGRRGRSRPARRRTSRRTCRTGISTPPSSASAHSWASASTSPPATRPGSSMP